MSRHLLPQLHIHVGDALHHGAQWISAHPAATAALVLAPACVASGVFGISTVRRRLAPVMARFAPLRAKLLRAKLGSALEGGTTAAPLQG